MVAISLCRGNLHRVPDVPRRWLMPAPKISLRDFKLLLHRRSRALSRLHSTTTKTTTTTSNPNPNLKQDEEDAKRDDNSNDDPRLHPTKLDESEEGVFKDGGTAPELKKNRQGSDGGVCSVKPEEGSDTPVEDKHVVLENASDQMDPRGVSQEEKTEVLMNPNSKTSNKEDVLNDRQKRKREVEEKLQVLNEKKHNLVQLLKQVLTAEEELKRRSCMQGMVVRPSLQVDAANDSGSMTRLVTPSGGSEGNLGGDMEGAEADDFSNHNMHSRHLLRMSSTSPSSDSPHRRPFSNAVPHPSRATLGVVGSPSRFAPTGQQGHPANLPTVFVSGTSYIASSPSPAASGGTSVFRDGQHPSPWN